MFKQNTMEESKFYHKDLSGLEEFLLAHSSLKEAFINLSRIKEIIRKEELLEEIKRLIKEQIINQIRTMKGFH
jgi:hypothetical protein